ncbi:unnamed protein product, partial [Brenthis ino]
MNSYEEIYKSICRICLKYDNNKNMVSLIDNNDKNGVSCHGKAVINFANISIKKQDCFPTAMCVKCLNLLKQAIYFKLLCESSDTCLKNLSKNVEKEKLKERVVEYTMLKYYFPKECFVQNEEELAKIKPSELEKCRDLKLLDINTVKEKDECSNAIIVLDNYFETESVKLNTSQDDDLLDRMESLIDTDAYKSINIENPVKIKNKLKRKLKNHISMKRRINCKKNVESVPLICNICNKELSNQHTYRHHMQRHNGCRYICEHCGKGFPVRTELQIHQVSRHGTGPYLQCSTCPFKAPRKFDLIEHERIHSGERPYTCEKCGLTFRRRGIWKKHLIYHTEKKIQCPQCPRKFFQRSEMLAHANNVHDRVYVYLCNKCGATYAKTATVRRHMMERHGIPREMQGKVIRINKVILSSYI